MTQTRSTTYKDAGVDIDAGNRLVERIKPHVKTTNRAEVIGGIGGFGGLFALDKNKYADPVLVSGTDGVGTKLRLAIDLGIHDTIGIDLVAMCVNDIAVLGAEPLFFLDYFGCGKLDEAVATNVVAGIADGCRQAGAALIGGETAEMPGMYADADYDLAGFCVGIVDRVNIIDGTRVAAGDQLLALASSGPHSNGYSLIRKIVADTSADLNMSFESGTLGQTLLTPTRIYTKALLALHQQQPVHAMAHITGGGLPENLVRVLHDTVDANIDLNAWQRPAVFDWLQEAGGVPDNEMLRTFNCGVGMLIALPADSVGSAIRLLEEAGETVSRVGEISAGTGQVNINP